MELQRKETKLLKLRLRCVGVLRRPLITYSKKMATPQLHIFSDNSELQKALCDLVAAKSKKSENDHGHFSIGLSGGSLAKMLSQGLRDRKDITWTSWLVYYCDERHVPFSDGESTHAYYKKEFFEHVPIEHIYTINPDVPVQAAAVDYIMKIRKVYPTGMPVFDLLLLGMGPDGHTCSLFPGHPGLDEAKKWVIPIQDSPKPPPCRITMTYPVLNNALCVVVTTTGESKAQSVRCCLEPSEDESPLPAGRVRPTNGELHWFMDEGAASKLEKK